MEFLTQHIGLVFTLLIALAGIGFWFVALGSLTVMGINRIITWVQELRWQPRRNSICAKIKEVHDWCSHEFPDVGLVCNAFIDELNNVRGFGPQSIRERLREQQDERLLKIAEHGEALAAKESNKSNLFFKLSAYEIQSGSTRVAQAEGLIRQLPLDHDGRNTWLLNYGVSEEAKQKRLRMRVHFALDTKSALNTRNGGLLSANSRCAI